MAQSDKLAEFRELQKLALKQAEKLKKKYIDSHKEAKDAGPEQGSVQPAAK